MFHFADELNSNKIAAAEDSPHKLDIAVPGTHIKSDESFDYSEDAAIMEDIIDIDEENDENEDEEETDVVKEEKQLKPTSLDRIVQQVLKRTKVSPALIRNN